MWELELGHGCLEVTRNWKNIPLVRTQNWHEGPNHFRRHKKDDKYVTVWLWQFSVEVLICCLENYPLLRRPEFFASFQNKYPGPVSPCCFSLGKTFNDLFECRPMKPQTLQRQWVSPSSNTLLGLKSCIKFWYFSKYRKTSDPTSFLKVSHFGSSWT